MHSVETKTDSPHADTRLAPQWIWKPERPLPGRTGGALFGLSFAVKDNIHVLGMPTTAACVAFSHLPRTHAFVVQRLLDAGASLVGKTNLDQFACGLNGTRSPWGAVANAFDSAYVAGGSSSGSAIVVANGEVDFALGTDTAGSGRVPAGLNNIVGLKPSRGLISASGTVPAAQSVDCVSIFARSVDVASRVLEAAVAHDRLDPYSRPLALASRPFPAALRFGVPASPEFFGDGAASAAWHQAVARLTSLGGTPTVVDFSVLSQAAALLYESALLAERYAAIRSFFDAHERDIMEPVRSIIGRGREYSAADYCEAQTRLRKLSRQADTMWDDIDVLMVPTAPTHYTIEQMRRDPVALNNNLGRYTNFVNLLDYAAISVPSAIRSDGLPFGVTLIGPCASDWQLADLGQRYHQASGLTQGATGQPLPPARSIAALHATSHERVLVAVVGAHLSGMPLNRELLERGATLVKATSTAPDYRLFSLPGTVPAKPGLLRTTEGRGAAIAVEVWDMPLQSYGSFVALVGAPLCIGTIRLADRSSVQGFLCEPQGLLDAVDITHLGGWRAYLNSITQGPP